MTCGLLDLICHVQSAGDALVMWLLGLVSTSFLIGMVIGAELGRRYGILAVITTGLAALAVIMARRHEPDVAEHVPDHTPDARGPFRRTVKPKPGKGPQMPPESLN